ncbi:hypothetical protein XK44_003637 [Salmonella enterica subsp. enterica]|uniref:Uncharacterized protein n=7 Tax=Rosemountvirus yarpen TaxID=2846142 RepID=A0A6G8RCA0_9CAUD|nr:hypothetical protein HWD19_gp23 [Salmonella phage yarpen]EBY3944481.1 hypothetical protein [Salmonella enterica subsp. enterica serovar Kottbus]EEJ2154880.1 hypothetical protein [Salmonella enterica subsp. enterica]QIN98244.1 hypothetical protein emiel_21 [Salmonella phage emiel]QIN98456.1 hypothetical protein nenneke_24 [Salmonella phage nenneke]QIN98830.1 hypothetical protein zoltan_24 [Salmonella phage zoltan]QIN98972.1 hypothetical protein renfri_24 [Salmonella phage renfri]QIN99045.1
MFHTLKTFQGVSPNTDEQVIEEHFVTFRTSDIVDISVIVHNDTAEIVYLTLRGTQDEDGAPPCMTFKREWHAEAVESLVALRDALHITPTYFTDNDGSLFPYSNVMYVNIKTRTMHLVNGVAIALTKNEFDRFYDEYRNWMDLYK